MTASKRRGRPVVTAVDLAAGLLACCLLLGVAVFTAGLVVAGAGLDHGIALAVTGAAVAVVAGAAWAWSTRPGKRLVRSSSGRPPASPGSQKV